VTQGRHLDNNLRGVDIPTLYPSRFEAPRVEDQAALRAVIAENPDPAHWIAYINPHRREGIHDPTPRMEHRTNCAEAARCVQATLWGDPHVAHGLRAGGLPLAENHEARYGEHPAYTEQWAGKQPELTTIEHLHEKLGNPESEYTSAIVFATRRDGSGHAFNAYRRADGSVGYLDGQTGKHGEWPPERLTEPSQETWYLEAIFFTPEDTPNRSQQ
jgi:hypothetical protein